MRCPTTLTSGQQCILAAGHPDACTPYCSHEPPPPARPLPVFAAQADLDAELHYKLGIEPLLQRLLANRPTCPMHPDVLVEPDTSQPLPDLSAMDAENGYRITVHWRCPHPDHDVPCATCRGSGCAPPTGTQPDGWGEGTEHTDPPPCPTCGGLGTVRQL